MTDHINRYLLTLGLSFWALLGMCQSNGITVSGKVTDKESGLALEGISVYVNNTTYSTQTQKDGSFRLTNIPLLHFELIFSAVNYETQARSIDNAGNTAPLNIQMQKNAALLNEVVVTASVEKMAGNNMAARSIRIFLAIRHLPNNARSLIIRQSGSDE
ncbi:carboxypeptidase-like regulatory domain-containing protein [Niabella hibiscisoli]|uniref:carboxypeptidase-like regulatory domain-containing protein n=1 Tax=Niabella hibiscisoli TaxID=1825928 RepID=UPI001F10CE0F|nr:carboxypeptidase-like regulatory domain-containing protein [Niabella hibiscisoli]MCH5721238.1 carboxypeptidase-like regulatory domain-containing protein [Niabella hibiscisoli]